jgi:hypothetical protein
LGNHLLHKKASFRGGQYDFNLHASLPSYRAAETQVPHASFTYRVHVDTD